MNEKYICLKLTNGENIIARNPDKSKNPFAYFTQIIYFAFLRRIQKEKKQMYIRHKSIENY